MAEKVIDKKVSKRIGKIETDAGSQEMTINEKEHLDIQEIQEILKENEKAEQAKKEEEEKKKAELTKASDEMDALFKEEQEEHYPGKEGFDRDAAISARELMPK